ncbi:DNA mismatch repair protein Mlh3-like [Octopus vulgaris]|uniref:DNA mismatch repair protein Mlh3-like n=1 Tax=Octopus vulgaris TaxID=6645 RepID=A0AA36F1I0_OCTVU|nr:DNA mismatch repair protein Mlh3-like [Octopus vulgaris]
MIKQLPASVQSYIRSGVAITSVTQCVEELLLNAVDAGAKCIAVRVDLSCFRIQVVDNGSGIAVEELDKVGQRYSTSKCQGIEDLDSLNYFGYRGEALASLCNISSLLEINTRTQLSAQTYSKIFQHGKPLPTIESKNPRPSPGTTLTLHNLFYNLPVRQKSIRLSLELENICHRVEALALLQPKLSITLRNDVTGSVMLQTHKTSSLLNTFSYLFGHTKSESLCEVSHSSGYFSLSGYIGRDNHYRKDIQFIYINKRLVLNTKIHKVINNILKKSLIIKQKLTLENSEKVSPSKLSKKYPIFLLNIKCPLNVYDITFDPRKTMVEFIEMENLLQAVEEMCWNFLRKENLMTVDSLALELKKESKFQLNGSQSPLDSMIRDPDKEIDDNIEDQLYDNVKSRALKSLPIKRNLFKTKLDEQDNDLNIDDSDIPSKFSKKNYDKEDIDNCLDVSTESQVQYNSADSNENESLTEGIDESLTENIDTPVIKSPVGSSKSFGSCTKLLTESISIFTETPSTVEEDSVSCERSKCVEDTKRNILAQRKMVANSIVNERILKCKTSRSKMTLPSAFRIKKNYPTRAPSEMKASTRSILDQFRSSSSSRQFSLAGTKKSSDLISESLNSSDISKTLSFESKTGPARESSKTLSNKMSENEIFCHEHFSGDSTAPKHEVVADTHQSISSKLANLLKKKSGDKMQVSGNIKDRVLNEEAENLSAIKDKQSIDLPEKPKEIPVLNNHLIMPENFPYVKDDGISLLRESETKYTSLKKNHDDVLLNDKISGDALIQNECCRKFGEHRFLTSSSFLQTYRKNEKNDAKSNLQISKDFHGLQCQNFNLNTYSKEEILSANKSHTSSDGSRKIGFDLPSFSKIHETPISTITDSFQEHDIPSNHNCFKCNRSDSKYEDRMENSFVFNFDAESKSDDASLSTTQDFDTVDITNSSLCLSSHLHSKTSTCTDYFFEVQYEQPSSLKNAASSYHRNNSESSQTVHNPRSLHVINPESFSPCKLFPEGLSNINTQRFSMFQDALESKLGDRILTESLYVDGTSSSKMENADSFNFAHPSHSCTKPHKTPKCFDILTSKTENFLPCISEEVEEVSFENTSNCSPLHNNSSEILCKGYNILPQRRINDIREEKLDGFRAPCNLLENKTMEYIPFNVLLSNNYGSDDDEEEDGTKSTVVHCESSSKCELSNNQGNGNPKTEDLNKYIKQVTINESEKSRNITDTFNSNHLDSNERNMSKHYLLETNTEFSECPKHHNASEESIPSPKPESSTSDTPGFLEPFHTNLNSKSQVQSHLNSLTGSISSKNLNITHCNESSFERQTIKYDGNIDKEQSLIKENELIKSSSENCDVALHLSERKKFDQCPVIRSCSSLSQHSHIATTRNKGQKEDCGIVVDNGQLNDNTCNRRSQQQVEKRLSSYQEKPCQQNVHYFNDEDQIENYPVRGSYMTVDNGQTVGNPDNHPLHDHCINTSSRQAVDNYDTYQLHDNCMNEGCTEAVDNCSSYESHDICINAGSSNAVDNGNTHPLRDRCINTDSCEAVDNCNSYKPHDLCINAGSSDAVDNGNTHPLRDRCINTDSYEAVDKCSDAESQNKRDGSQDRATLLDRISISTNIEKSNISASKNKNSLEFFSECDLATRCDDLLSVRQTDALNSVMSQNFDSDTSASPDLTTNNMLLYDNSPEAPSTSMDMEQNFAVKIRDSDDDKITEVDYTNSTKESDPIIELWNIWKNTVFRQAEKEILKTWINNFKGAKHRRVTHQCQFTKTMLSQLEAVGQVDKKFIACIVRSGTCPTTTPDHLIIVDQHAAHERVRLEQLTEEMYQTEDTNGDTPRRISYSNIVPPLVLSFSDREMRMIQSFFPEFLKIGIELTMSTGDNSIEVHTAPSCIVAREASERKYNRRSVIEELLQTLIKEQIELLQDTHGSRGSLPKTIHNVLCSQACHTAIKFGTVLTLKECKDLMQMLLKCKLPFQCAHGRPSMIPLLNLQYFKNSLEKSRFRKINLRKLRENLKEQQQQGLHQKEENL